MLIFKQRWYLKIIFFNCIYIFYIYYNRLIFKHFFINFYSTIFVGKEFIKLEKLKFNTILSNNCHSHVARALEEMEYDGKT